MIRAMCEMDSLHHSGTVKLTEGVQLMDIESFIPQPLIQQRAMFRVMTPGFSQEFERWTDALNTAKFLQPKCKSIFEDIRIYDGENLVWVYSRSHTYPQYIGPGTYKRLAILFLQEAQENGEE